jgi:hypothetical protein
MQTACEGRFVWIRFSLIFSFAHKYRCNAEREHGVGKRDSWIRRMHSWRHVDFKLDFKLASSTPPCPHGSRLKLTEVTNQDEASFIIYSVVRGPFADREAGPEGRSARTVLAPSVRWVQRLRISSLPISKH